MTDILAAIGIVELERYETEILRKREFIFDYYNKVFLKYNWAIIPISRTETKKSSNHLYMLRIKDIGENKRNDIIDAIFSAGVCVNVHFQPLPLLSYYRNLGYNITDFEIAYKNFANEITLPVFFDLTIEQLNTITNTVITCVERILHKQQLLEQPICS